MHFCKEINLFSRRFQNQCASQHFLEKGNQRLDKVLISIHIWYRSRPSQNVPEQFNKVLSFHVLWWLLIWLKKKIKQSCLVIHNLSYYVIFVIRSMWYHIGCHMTWLIFVSGDFDPYFIPKTTLSLDFEKQLTCWTRNQL